MRPYPADSVELFSVSMCRCAASARVGFHGLVYAAGAFAFGVQQYVAAPDLEMVMPAPRRVRRQFRALAFDCLTETFPRFFQRSSWSSGGYG